MTTDLVVHNNTEADLAVDMRYAQALAGGDRNSGSLLPASYRGNPANVLIAVGLGRALGIQPAQALYEIYVVNGRPSMSANLMAALVRRAGHRLRVNGDETRCVATLFRADDPDFEYRAEWTIERARQIKLAGKDTWRDYPAAMLRARAISEVVRAGASEAILGMEFSREEAADIPAAAEPAQRATAADFIVTAPTNDGGANAPAPDGRSEQVELDAPPSPNANDDLPADEPITPGQLKALGVGMRDAGITDRDHALTYVSDIVGRQIGSRNELSRHEAGRVLDQLKVDAADQKAADDAADESWLQQETVR